MTAKPKTDVVESVRMERGEPTFADQMALATTLLRTGFLPTSIKTPGQALAIILTGREMKIGPMQSLRSISVINGRPVLAADLQLALFKRDGGQAKWLTNTPTVVKLWLKHPNGDEHIQEYSMEDASRAELDKNPGRTYQKFPAAMLRARAITSGLKAIGYEPVTGVYDPSELATVPLEAPEIVDVAAQLPDTEPDRPAPPIPSQATAPAPAKAGRKADFTPTTFRGTPLSALATDELLKLRDWAVQKDNVKYREHVEAIDNLLAARD